MQGQAMWKKAVPRVTRPRLHKMGLAFNALKENHRNMEAMYGDARSGKLYLPAFAETVTMVVDLFKKCFGTSKVQPNLT